MTGTARVRHLKRKPDCIVVGYVTEEHQLTAFAVFRPKFERQESEERFRVYDYPQDGFAVAVDASNLPKSALVLRGWDVDMAQQKAFPLTESINIREGSDGSF